MRNAHDDSSSTRAEETSISEISEQSEQGSGEAHVNTILGLSLSDIANQNLLADELREVPAKFRDAHHWCNTFHPFLVEEMRVKLHTHLEKSFSGDKKAPCRLIFFNSGIYLLLPRPDDFKENAYSMTLGLLTEAKIASSKNQVQPLVIADSDHCLILFHKSRSLKDEKYVQSLPTQVRTWVDEAGRGSHILTKVAYCADEVPAFLKSMLPMLAEHEHSNVCYMSKDIHVTFLCEAVIPSLRIASALNPTRLHDIRTTQNAVLTSILENERGEISRNPLFDLTRSDNRALLQRIKTIWKSLKLNKSQLESLQEIFDMETTSFNPVQLIKGPPGTGKTKTLVALIVGLYLFRLRIHMAAPTNAAVRELLRRFDERFMEVLTSNDFIYWRKKRAASIVFVGQRRESREDESSPATQAETVEDDEADESSDDEGNRASTNAPPAMWREVSEMKDCLFKYDSRLRCRRLNYAAKHIDRCLGDLRAFVVKYLGYSAEDIDDCEVLNQTVEVDEKDEPVLTHCMQLAHQSHAFLETFLWELPSHFFSQDCPEADKKMMRLKTLLEVDMSRRLKMLESHHNDLLRIRDVSAFERHALSRVKQSCKLYHELLRAMAEARGLLQIPDQTATSSDSDSISSIATSNERRFRGRRGLVTQRDLVFEAYMVCSTVNGGGRSELRRKPFNVVVVDEAAQLVQAELAILLKSQLKCLVLAGDDKQLAATVFSGKSKKFRYEESLMGRFLRTKAIEPHLLRVQYRMHPQISRWPNYRFYGNNIEDGENVTSPAYVELPWQRSLLPPFSVLNVEGCESVQQGDGGGSTYNHAEAIVVSKLVQHMRNQRRLLLDEESNAITGPFKIGVISPYKAQVKLLKALIKDIDNTPIEVRVSTVDSFQGQECDVIIFSAVRANNNGEIGFLRDPRRLNVAITRAKHSLVLVGHVETLATDRMWRNLLEHAAEEECVLRSCDADAVDDDNDCSSFEGHEILLSNQFDGMSQLKSSARRSLAAIIREGEREGRALTGAVRHFTGLKNGERYILQTQYWEVVAGADWSDSLSPAQERHLKKKLVEYTKFAKLSDSLTRWMSGNLHIPADSRGFMTTIALLVVGTSALHAIVSLEHDIIESKKVLRLWCAVPQARLKERVAEISEKIAQASF